MSRIGRRTIALACLLAVTSAGMHAQARPAADLMGGTPPNVVARLNKAVNDALKTPEVRAMIEGSGGAVLGGTPQDHARFLGEERARWEPLIRKANITID